MASKRVAAFFPILPGKTQAWKEFARELNGPKRREYKGLMKRAGIKHEFVCLQSTPQGDFAVVSLDDGWDWAAKLSASKEPFDQWFMKKIEEFHGLKSTDPIPPPNETLLDAWE